MIALLENEFVEKKKYMEKDEFIDMVAIAESTPGPIAINAATYIGYKQAGSLGATIMTLGVCVPSFTIIYVISLFFDAFLSLKFVECAFRGIQVCVVYLILSAGIKMFGQMKKTALSIVIVSTVIICMVLFSLFSVKFSTIFYILLCGILGLAIYFFKQIKQKKEEKK